MPAFAEVQCIGGNHPWLRESVNPSLCSGCCNVEHLRRAPQQSSNALGTLFSGHVVQTFELLVGLDSIGYCTTCQVSLQQGVGDAQTWVLACQPHSIAILNKDFALRTPIILPPLRTRLSLCTAGTLC